MPWEFDDSGKATLNGHIDAHIKFATGDWSSSVLLANDSVQEAHKTLGCWKSVQWDQKKQEKVLQEKSDFYAQIILSSSVSQQENWIAYYAIYHTRMTFVLPTSYLSQKQLDRIQMRAISATLTKGGFVVTFPTRRPPVHCGSAA